MKHQSEMNYNQEMWKVPSSISLLCTTVFLLVRELTSACYPNKIIQNGITTSVLASGPYQEQLLPNTSSLDIFNSVPTNGKVQLNFHFKLNPMPTPSWTWNIGDEMVVLQMEQKSAASGNLLFFKVVLRYAGVNYWMPVFVNDNMEVVYSPINLVTSNWYVDVGMGTSNPDMQQVIRFIVNNAAGTNKAFLVMSESWDFTQKILVRLFALNPISSWYFNGAIGRIDYVGGYFSTTGSATNEEITMELKLPSIEYWLDFEDPMFSQYFKNRANTSYTDAINGYSNHSDFQDIQFDFNDGWVNRKNMMLIQLPKFAWNEDMDINNIWYFKLKFRHVNHWAQQGEQFWFYYYGNPGSPYYYAYLYKWDYGTPIRVRTVFPGQGDWDTCYYTISPANEFGNSGETAYGQATFRPPYSRNLIVYRYTCSIAGLSAYRALSTGYMSVPNPTITFGGADVFHQQAPGIPSASNKVYPSNPFIQPSPGTTNRASIMIEFILREFVYTTGSAHSSQWVMPSAANCRANTQMILGFDSIDMPLVCNSGYKNYHEVAMCIADPLIAGSTDCSHDMNSVGSKCFRCPRSYGHSGTDACSQCYANCLGCAGPNPDQCNYCGLGYGFTGVSCNKCASTETWDLTKNTCQLTKVAYLEINFDATSFGQVQLYFLPLGGYADLSLYYEYLYDKYWIIDINFNYEFCRTYTNIPLHRKVSISFEIMGIDTRSFDPVTWSVDTIYLGFLNWALEDQGMNTTTSFWGYGYRDQMPTKYTHTILHSTSTMNFVVKPFFTNDWQTVWIRELNVSFFGCFSTCATCWEDNSPVNCLSCLDGYYFKNYQCKACSSSCQTCSGNPYTCTSCPSSQKLLAGFCIAACGVGYYADSTGTCQTCPSTCVQCISTTKCLACVNGYYLDGTNMCSACDLTQCQTCLGTPTTCTSCNSGYMIQNSACLLASTGCSAGYYQVGSTSCQPCPTGCDTCDSTTCLACSVTYIPKGVICAPFTSCGAGWYNSAGISCQQCMSVCQTCSNGVSCDSCKPGYGTSACLPCVSPCVTCSGSTTSCTSCDPSTNTYLQSGGGTCVAATQCNPGSYAETNNQCMACSSDCATCTGTPFTCLSCSDPTKTWSNYNCVTTCGTGMIAIAGMCCPNNCTGCNVQLACSGCITGYYLTQNSSCAACNPNCVTCVTNPTQCTTCASSQILQGSTCQDKCNIGFYAKGTSCTACDQSCSTCSGPLNTQCLTCATNYVLWQNLCWPCLPSGTGNADSRFELRSGKCWEKCGIGSRLRIDDIPEGLGGYKACDDGNQNSGDGCSSSCVIEMNYNCVGGSQTKPDYCYPRIKPIAVIYPINNSTEFQISFSSIIQFRNISDRSNKTDIPVPIVIDIAGISNMSYSVVWSKPKISSFDYVNFTIKSQTRIENKKITAYLDTSMIADQYNNTLSTQKLRTNTTIIVDKSFFFQTVFTGLQVTNKVINCIIPMSSLGITNFITQNFIRYITTFQLIGAGIFYNVNQTSTVTNLLKQASVITRKTLPGPMEMMQSKLVVYNTSVWLSPQIKTSLSGRLLSSITGSGSSNTNLSTYSKLFDLSDSPLPMRRNGFTVSLIPNLSFSIVVILITGAWNMVVSYCAFGKVTVRDGLLKRIAALGAEKAFLTAAMMGALELTFFSTYNVLHPKFDHIANLLSFLVSVMILISAFILPGLLYILADQHPIELWHPEYYERFGFIYCEFKFSNSISKSFMAIILMRVIVFGFIAAVFMEFPLGQTGLLFSLHLIYFLILVNVRPFVSRLMNIITIFAELFILGSSFCFLASTLDNQQNWLSIDMRENLDLVNCTCIMLVVIFTVIGVFMMIFLKFFQIIKRRFDFQKLNHIMPHGHELQNLEVHGKRMIEPPQLNEAGHKRNEETPEKYLKDMIQVQKAEEYSESTLLKLQRDGANEKPTTDWIQEYKAASVQDKSDDWSHNRQIQFQEDLLASSNMIVRRADNTPDLRKDDSKQMESDDDDKF